MTPARLDINIKKGVTFGPLVIKCKNAAGTLVDLTDWIPYAEVRKKPLLPVIIDLAPTITTPTSGEIIIGFTDEETEDMNTGEYCWDLLLEDPDGNVLGPYVKGSCTIADTITKI